MSICMYVFMYVCIQRRYFLFHSRKLKNFCMWPYIQPNPVDCTCIHKNLCVLIYVGVCMYVCMYAFIRRCLLFLQPSKTHVCADVYTHTYTHVYVYILVRSTAFKSCMHAYICICTYIYTHIYTCIHTCSSMCSRKACSLFC